MITSGIIEIDCHGKNVEQAILELERQINNAPTSVYRIRAIHGYNGGTRIKNAIINEFGYHRNDKVIRITGGINEGITELVLREY